jgi:hypothetical protein
MSRKKPEPLPLAEVRAGDIFVMPLADGRFGACRVVRVRKDKHSRRALVYASAWVGTAPPDLAEPLLRRILVLTHHSWKNEPEILWVDAPVPGDFTRLGRLPMDDDDAELEAHGSGHWVHFPMQVLMQWRWDHQRATVLAEEEAQQKQREAAAEQYAHSYKPLPPHPLERLRRKQFSPGGEDYVEPEVLRAVRRAIRELIDGLIALGPDAPVPLQLNLFHWATEQFNALDDGWIDTIAREDLCEILEDIAAAAGLVGYDDQLHARRDW